MKKISILLLLAAMLSSMSGCGGSGEETSVSTAEIIETEQAETAAETEKDWLAALPSADYGGFAFRILAVPEENCSGIQSFWAEEPNGEIINDTVYERNLYVEDLYNISIGYEGKTGVIPQTANLVKSGDATYSAVSDEAKLHMAYSTQGIFMNLYGIDAIDLTSPWWYTHAVEALTIADRLYAGYSDLNTQIMERVACEFVNLDMVTDHGMEDPYQLVVDGKWTLDVMREMAEAAAQDLDTDGKISQNDIGGYAVGIGSYNVLINGAGCPLATKSDDGKVTLHYGSEAFINAAEKVAALVNDEAFTIYLNKNMWGIDLFSAGKVLFREANLYVYNDLREYDSYFGILPVPKFDEAQENYRSMMNNSSMGISIPVSVKDAEQVGTIVEALNAYSYLHLKDAYYETMLKGKLARDSQSIDMLDIITSTIVVDYGVMNENTWGNVISSWLTSIQDHGAGNLASLAASNMEKFNTLYEEILAAYESQP